MTADDLLARISPKVSDPVDVDGRPIEEFAGTKIRALSAEDQMAVQDYGTKHGSSRAYKMSVARGVLKPDGTRLFTDEDAERIGDSMAEPIYRVVQKVRQLTGMDAPEGDEEKKIGSTPAPTPGSSST